MNNTKLNFAKTISDTINPMMSDCYSYGMMSGCDENCPVLNEGKCEIYGNVEEYLEGK